MAIRGELGAGGHGGSDWRWWPAILKGQAAWTAGVATLWILGLFWAPLDPDYTSGELLDHLLAWLETGTLYSDPTLSPHRVLNYPPLALAMARGLTVLGLPPLMAGRLLGTGGLGLILFGMALWLRDLGVPRRRILLSLGAVGGSFPLLYSGGQFHLEGWAVGATLLGFWSAGKGGRWSILAGALLALACLFKQTQVVLGIVALGWILVYRPGREGLRATAAFGLVGITGCLLITGSFGLEAWRHMLLYTVGTFSLQQLGVQYLSFVLPWALFIFLALRAFSRRARGPSDASGWYLVAAGVWSLSALREGSSYAYFLDLHLAILLWVVPLFWQAGEAGIKRVLAVQMVGASLIVGSILLYDLLGALSYRPLLPTLCRELPQEPALAVTESPGLTRACGGVPALHPFITASLARKGLWDPGPFEEELAKGTFGSVLLPFHPGVEVPGVSRQRWTSESLRIFRDRYQVIRRVGPMWVLEPEEWSLHEAPSP